MFSFTPVLQACELHFCDEDIEREMSHFDRQTGRTLTAKLNVPRLRAGAIPSKFAPVCSSSNNLRNSTFRKRRRVSDERTHLADSTQSTGDADQHSHLPKELPPLSAPTILLSDGLAQGWYRYVTPLHWTLKGWIMVFKFPRYIISQYIITVDCFIKPFELLVIAQPYILKFLTW